MSIYSIDGSLVSAAYTVSGISTQCFDIEGNLLSGDYYHYDTEYQHSILIARDEWAEEYREDNTVLPIVLFTDAHGALGSDFAKELFRYLSLAVNWNECAACINLGDVTDSYNVTGFEKMQTCLAPIPIEKQINIWGNHETWGSDWPNIDWTTLKSYYDNSEFNGYSFKAGTKCDQSVEDRGREIRFVIVGAWDYDENVGGNSSYVMDSDNIDALISMLSQKDGYDIVFLSHIQPYDDQLQADGVTKWYIPAVDGEVAYESTDGRQSILFWRQHFMTTLMNARKAKTSGSITGFYSDTHDYDFTECESDLLCCFAGHSHADGYNWQGGNARNLPIVVFDALFYQHRPFYFVNVNRTAQKINVWKIDDTAAIYRYSVDFAQQQSA